MTFTGYTKRETGIIKGFAILSIVFHNYFHWLAPSPGENEFDFSPVRIKAFFQMLGEQPGEFVNILFSYLGHYGVQLFIMISGFGLVMSMMNHRRSWESFVLNRLKKLYPLLLTGVIFYFFERILEGSKVSPWDMKQIGQKLLLVHTLIPNSGLSINGPWWFFGLIFQLYLLFPLLYRGMEKWGWKFFLAVCVVSYGLIFLFRDGFLLYKGTILMQNAPGHLPEFCFGMMLAFSKDRKIHWAWLLLAVALFVMGNSAPGLYPFTFLSLCVIAVFAIEKLKGKVRSALLSPFVYFGGLSMVLFAVHGFLRTPVLKWTNAMTGPWGHLASGALYFLLVWSVALAAKPVYEKMVSLLDKIHIRETRVTRIAGSVCAAALSVFFAYVLGYYVIQNLHTNDIPLEASTSYPAGVIQGDNTCVLMHSFTLDGNFVSISIEGSLDLFKTDPKAPKPQIALGITDIWWKTIDLTDSYENTFQFNDRFLCPFHQHTKGKVLNIFLWNTENVDFRFENAKISVMR